MAKVNRRRPAYLTKLIDALETDLERAGLPAVVKSEPIPTTKLHRVTVLASKFKALPHSDRQSLVWRIADNALPFEKQILISSILTLTPEEAGVRQQRAGRPSPRRRKTA